MLSRVIWAARTSLSIAGISVLVAMVFGVMIGLLSGYYGGWLDLLVMRLADMQLSFPYLLLAITAMASSRYWWSSRASSWRRRLRWGHPTGGSSRAISRRT